MTKRRPIWRPLTKPEVASTRYAGELATLRKYWALVRQQCEGRPEFEQHTRELLRRTVIETGQIEGVYTLDQGTTETLISRGFEATLIGHGGAGPVSAEQAVEILRDQQAAYEQALTGGMDLVGGTRTFGEAVVKELHAVLTRSQEYAEGRDSLGNRVRVELQRGVYKTRPNNPTRADGTVEEYCPPEQVGPQMETLFRIYHELEAEGADPVFLAAWFHHAFTTIHPFQDGNGRLVRLLASVILIKNGMLYLHIDRGAPRGEYLDALRRSDAGDMTPFVDLIGGQQKLVLLDGVQFGAPVEPSTATDTGNRLGRAIDRLRNIAIGDEGDRAWDDRLERYFEPLERSVRQVESSLQARLDPSRARIEVHVVTSERRYAEATQNARSIVPRFSVRPRSHVPQCYLRVRAPGLGSRGAIFWCAEPNCVVRGIVLTFVQFDRSGVSIGSLLDLPVVGDLEAGPDAIGARMDEVVNESAVVLLESLDAPG